MSTSDGSIEKAVVGAARLAFELGSTDAVQLDLVEWLVDQAPETPADDTESVRLFVEGIRARGRGVAA